MFGEGATYRQVLAGPGGRRIDGDYKVTVSGPPARLEFQITACEARRGVRARRETTPGATVVRFALDLHPTGAMKLLTPVIARQVRREVARLDSLKAIFGRAG